MAISNSTHKNIISVWHIFSPNQIAVFWMSISWRQRIYWYMDILRCVDMFLITKILDLAYVQNYMRCLSQNKSDTKLFRVYLFTVTNILLTITYSSKQKTSVNKISHIYKDHQKDHKSWRSIFFFLTCILNKSCVKCLYKGDQLEGWMQKGSICWLFAIAFKTLTHSPN